MPSDKKKIILIAMPFAETSIPSIQLALLETYLTDLGVNITSKHLYLKSAEFYGLNNYNKILFSSNGSYSGQIAFSKYVFPKHWEDFKKNIQIYFDKKINSQNKLGKIFTFDDYIDQTDSFFKWVIDNIEWNNYDIIGFTINFGQFLPSLAISKKIKELYPQKIIVFGGSRTAGKLGISTLNAFNYVDFIVSGDGEKSLYLLATDFDNYKNIPRLIYREGNKINWNNSKEHTNLNALPVPSYDCFFEELYSSSDTIQQYFDYYGKLPIELSRGCWWNNCSFCNVKLQNEKYNEKNFDNFINELITLSDKYQILRFQVINNLLPLKDYRLFFEKIIELGRDFTFYVESRADRLNCDDYRLMKQAGFSHIQTGIETFSQNYIKKMDKGTGVIDNISTLKFCKENSIINDYNLVVNYPNEEDLDFNETKKTIQLFKQYIDPPQVSPLIIGFESCIFSNPEKFNIENFEFTPVDKLMFPMEILEKDICYFYNYKQKEKSNNHNWVDLIDNWKKERIQRLIEGLKSRSEIDKYIFYFEDGKNFLRIYDKRDTQNIRILDLNEIERKIFLACTNIISLQELQEEFFNIPDFQLMAILHSFEQKGIVYTENDHFVNLPLNIVQKNVCSSNITSQSILYNSGIQRTL